MQHQEPLPIFYDLGGHHTLEDTDEGGILIVEQGSTLYDLGDHALEVSQDRSILIAGHSAKSDPLKEIVQLDSDEVYKFFTVLKELFQ